MTYLLTASFPYFTGLARDVVMNTWHFEYLDGTPNEQAYSDLTVAMAGAYDNLYQPFAGPTRFAVPWVDWEQARWVIYDLDMPIPRPPVFEVVEGLDVDPIDVSAAPMEMAAVLSYRGEYTGGVNRQRQRGRIFLGGLGGNAVDSGDSSNFPVWKADLMTRMAAMGQEVMGLSTLEWQWVVYSRVSNISYPVVAGWVDAEIDTQRRRGNVVNAARVPWS